MTFSLRAALAIVALFGLVFAIMRNVHPYAAAAFLVAGCAGAGLILVARTEDIVPILRLLGSAFVGAIAGLVLLADGILKSQYGYDHGFGETEKSMFTAILIGTAGGIGVGLLLNRRFSDPPPPKEPQE